MEHSGRVSGFYKIRAFFNHYSWDVAIKVTMPFTWIWPHNWVWPTAILWSKTRQGVYWLSIILTVVLCPLSGQVKAWLKAWNGEANRHLVNKTPMSTWPSHPLTRSSLYPLLEFMSVRRETEHKKLWPSIEVSLWEQFVFPIKIIISRILNCHIKNLTTS